MQPDHDLTVSGFSGPIGVDALRGAKKLAAEALHVWQTAIENDTFSENLQSLFEHASTLLQAEGIPIDEVNALGEVAPRLRQPLSFRTKTERDRFVAGWALPPLKWRARLIQLPVRMLETELEAAAHADFLTRKLVRLPGETARSRFWIATSDLEARKSNMDVFRGGHLTDEVRKIVWKETVGIRAAYAQAMPLVNGVTRKNRRSLRKWWLTGLALMNRIEKQQYDILSRDVHLTRSNRLQLVLQSIFVRSSFFDR